MNKKDLAAFRRRFTPDKNDISIIRGCFVNEKGEIVSTFSKSPISLPASEAEHYLSSFKKTLGGVPGRNQFSIPVNDEASHLLLQLQSSELKDETAMNALFAAIREKLEFDGAYLTTPTAYPIKRLTSTRIPRISRTRCLTMSSCQSAPSS